MRKYTVTVTVITSNKKQNKTKKFQGGEICSGACFQRMQSVAFGSMHLGRTQWLLAHVVVVNDSTHHGRQEASNKGSSITIRAHP